MGSVGRRRFLLETGALVGAPLFARAQSPRTYSVGIVHLGGDYSAAFDGLRDGLKEFGLQEGKQIDFLVHNLEGDRKLADSAARNLERQKVDLIYSITTSVSIAVKRATNTVPVVFYAGTDPVRFGLVQSLARPGGRLTGIYSQVTSLMAKRLQLLKELIPTLHRVAYFYDRRNPLAEEVTRAQRVAARQLDLGLVERPVDSAASLQASLDSLRPGDADAVAYVDSLVVSQTAMVIEFARAKRLAIMAPDRASVAQGALASYGVSYYRAGQLAAKQVDRILHGVAPSDLPVEQMDRLHFAINLKTAKAIGLAIPQPVLLEADEVIE